jgi:hypothetical protein
MNADQERLEQLKDKFAEGDEDTQDNARAEMLNSGGLSVEESIRYLGLASCVKPDHRIRRRAGVSRRVHVHRTQGSAAHQQQTKYRAALRSLEQFIQQKIRLRKTKNRRAK